MILVDSENKGITYQSREHSLSPLKRVVWRMKRAEHKGTLVHIKKYLDVYKFKGRTSDFHTLEFTHLPVGVVVMVVDYVPVQEIHRYSYTKDIFAFLVLHGEGVYLVDEQQMEWNEKLEERWK